MWYVVVHFLFVFHWSTKIINKLTMTTNYCTQAFTKTRNRTIFVWPWKMVSVSVHYLFYQPMDEKIKTCPIRLPAKENPNMEKALFDWSIISQYDIKAKYRLISRKFLDMKFFCLSVHLTNQKPPTFVSVRQTNQIAQFFVCLLFLSSSRVFISRSYENCSKIELQPLLSPQ